jgi:ketosteroid isomerase-like protein
VRVSEENVEIVRELIALGERARESGAMPHTDLVTPDAEIDLSRRVFNPAVYRGYDGWARLNDELREVWAEWRVSCERIIGVDDRVVSIETVRGRGRGSGVEIEARYASIWTLLNGQVTRVEVGFDPDEACKALGLEE